MAHYSYHHHHHYYYYYYYYYYYGTPFSTICTKVKDRWSCTLTHPVSLHGVHRDTFTFTFTYGTLDLFIV